MASFIIAAWNSLLPAAQGAEVLDRDTSDCTPEHGPSKGVDGEVLVMLVAFSELDDALEALDDAVAAHHLRQVPILEATLLIVVVIVCQAAHGK